MTSNEAAFTEGAKFLVFSYLVSLISKISRLSATHMNNNYKQNLKHKPVVAEPPRKDRKGYNMKKSIVAIA